MKNLRRDNEMRQVIFDWFCNNTNYMPLESQIFDLLDVIELENNKRN